MQTMRVVKRLPKMPDMKVLCYHLMPKVWQNDDEKNTLRWNWYWNRTDRNNGYLIGKTEQMILHKSSIAVIGNGGMGGPQCEIFARFGIGEQYIADNGTYDPSNIQRQPGATKKTIGAYKALEQGRRMWDITDDYHLWVCHHGLTEKTADFLIQGRNVAVDMIEFWSLADRLLLHRTCAKHHVVVLNCNSVGHSTNIIKFDYSQTVSKRRLGGYATLLEKAMRMTYERARYLQTQYECGKATRAEKLEIMRAVFAVFVPDAPEYFVSARLSSKKSLWRRLIREGKAPIISTNPPFAAGVCATEVFFEIMRQKSPVKRTIKERKSFPFVTTLDIGHQTFTTHKITAV